MSVGNSPPSRLRAPPLAVVARRRGLYARAWVPARLCSALTVERKAMSLLGVLLGAAGEIPCD